MKQKEIQDFINDIETKFPVDQWQIAGIHVWPIIRIDVMIGLYYHDTSYQQNTLNFGYKLRQGVNIVASLPKYAYAQVADRRHNAQIHPADVLFLADTDTRIKLQNHWYDRIIDPLVTELKTQNIAALVLEKSFHKFFIPRYSQSLFIQPRLDYLTITASLRSTSSAVLLPGHDKFLDYLARKYPAIPLPTVSRLGMIVSVITAYVTYFEQLLLAVQPKLGMVVSYYNPVGMAFTLALYRQGIPVVDLQHGAQGELHTAYGRWLRVPKTGYELVPRYFWNWTPADASAITHWGKQWHQAIVGGNPLLAVFQDNQNAIVRYYDKEMAASKATVNIIVSLSPLVDHNDYLFTQLVKIKGKLPSNCKWWFRVHPTTLDKLDWTRNQARRLQLANFAVDHATLFPLYALLRHADLHVTYESGAVVEAEAFGVLSLVLSDSGKDLFHDQIKRKHAIYCKDADAFALALQRYGKKRSYRQWQTQKQPLQTKALEILLNQSKPSKKQSAVAIILARGGSKRLPGKNIKILNSKPLIAWTIEAAKVSKYIDRVIVSTEAQEIAKVALQYGADVPFIRPKRYATDQATSDDALLHTLSWLTKHDKKVYKYFIYLQPTSPLRTARHIDEAFEKISTQPKADTLVSVTKFDKNPYWLKTVSPTGFLKSYLPNTTEQEMLQSPAVYIPNGAIYICKTKEFLVQKTRYTNKTLTYIMDSESSVDIDTPVEFLLAEQLMKSRG